MLEDFSCSALLCLLNFELCNNKPASRVYIYVYACVCACVCARAHVRETARVPI